MPNRHYCGHHKNTRKRDLEKKWKAGRRWKRQTVKSDRLDMKPDAKSLIEQKSNGRQK